MEQQDPIPEEPRRLYLAYGSNLNLAQMEMRCPTAIPVRRLMIRGWALVFREFLDIEPREGSCVYGALYSVTAEDEKALDLYEGVRHGFYRQVEFRIKSTGETAFFYRMNEGGYEAPPAPYYYNICKQGFRDWKLPLNALSAALESAYNFTQQEVLSPALRRPARRRRSRSPVVPTIIR